MPACLQKLLAESRGCHLGLDEPLSWSEVAVVLFVFEQPSRPHCLNHQVFFPDAITPSSYLRGDVPMNLGVSIESPSRKILCNASLLDPFYPSATQVLQGVSYGGGRNGIQRGCGCGADGEIGRKNCVTNVTGGTWGHIFRREDLFDERDSTVKGKDGIGLFIYSFTYLVCVITS